MIPIDRIKACSNPECRLVLPADPDNAALAGFWVRKREAGPCSRVAEWHAQCKDCHRQARRRRRAAQERVVLAPEERARRRAEHVAALKERQRTDPAFAARCRQRDVERKRRARRRAGIEPLRPHEEMLPVAPFQAWLRTAPLSRNALAKAAGVDTRRLRTIASGEYMKRHNGMTSRYEVKSVSYDFARRVLRAADVPMSDVWPDVIWNGID